MSAAIELHPLCSLFPRVTGVEFDALVADVKANGLREAITLHGGMILDGGNRYRACLEAGVQPYFREFEGESLVSFVLSANLHRRHLTPGQQAAIVASAQDWSKAQRQGGTGANQHTKSSGATLHLSTSSATRAAESGASLRTQKMADKVAKADPELAVRVGHGEVSLPKAHAQVSKKAPAEKPVEDAAPAAADEAESPDDEFAPSADELADAEAAEAETMALFRRAMESDDPLSLALKENARLVELNRGLQARLDGLLNEKNEAVRLAKSLQNKLRAIERASA